MEVEKELLMHWLHYHGNHNYTLEELVKIDEIIDKYGAGRVFDVAVASYIFGDGSPTSILASIRDNSVNELFESLPDITNMDEGKKALFILARQELYQIISQTA